MNSAKSGNARSTGKTARFRWGSTRLHATYRVPPPSHRHHQILILDAHWERFRHVGPFGQLRAGLDVDLEAAHLDAARIAPGFAGADVVFPGMPRTADHLPLARIAIFAGH